MNCSKSLQAYLLKVNSTLVDQKGNPPGSPEQAITDFFQWTQSLSKEGALALGACYDASFELV